MTSSSQCYPHPSWSIPGLPASIPHEFFDEVIKYQRYEVALENMLFRNMHGLERVERMAQGEQLPPPAAIDITVHKDPTELDSRAECLGEQVVEGQLSEPANEGDAGEGTIDADTAPSDSFSGPEQVVDESFAQPKGPRCRWRRQCRCSRRSRALGFAE